MSDQATGGTPLGELIARSPVGVCLTDEFGRFEFVNPAYCALFGYRKDELLGQPVTLVLPEALRDELSALHDRLPLAGEEEPPGEWEAVNRAGERLTVLAQASWLVGSDGRPRKATFVTDLTARRRAEEHARLLERAVAASASGIIITDLGQPDNPIVSLNPAFKRMTGFEASEVIGRNCRFLQADDREQPGLEEIRSAIRERREGRAVLRNYRKDGRLFFNELFVAPVADRDGRVTHFIGVQNDVTERHRADAAEVRARSSAAQVAELERELARLKGASGPAGTQPGSAASRPLAAEPGLFARLKDEYQALVDLAIERRLYRGAEDPRPRLEALAARLGALRGGPRDVIDLHAAVIRGASELGPAGRLEAVLDEGRLLALELMGHLVAYYRAGAGEASP